MQYLDPSLFCCYVVVPRSFPGDAAEIRARDAAKRTLDGIPVDVGSTPLFSSLVRLCLFVLSSAVLMLCKISTAAICFMLLFKACVF